MVRERALLFLSERIRRAVEGGKGTRDPMSSDHRLFRAVNERIRDVSRFDGDGSVGFLCECGRDDCVAVVPITLEGFDEIARRTNRFVVAPDHLLPDADRLVEAHDGFAIVEPLAGS